MKRTTFTIALAAVLARWVDTPSIRAVLAYAALFAGTLLLGTLINYLIGSLLRSAGGVADWRSAGIPEDLARFAIRYGYYARFRITLMRVLGMVDLSGMEDKIYAC